ncbi:MAG: tRNA1(Val) (adenine(37)-N6)-methyltransferase [Syntrophales bacterium]|nr:tRNA1(Val) (adenine(37)-N6)-methyltransferase [Syntrophales bacterium]
MNNETYGLRQDGETVDEFFRGRLRVLQKEKGYRFSVDSMLLADFVALRRGDHVVDLGTGSGIIALVLAFRFPEASIAEVEIQKDLADMAGRSIALNGLEDRIKVYPGDVKNIRNLFGPQSFNAAVFNPPYRRLNSGKINPDNERAVARHEIKGTVDDFLTSARYLLKDSGRVYVVYPAARSVQLIARMRGNDIEPKRLRIVHTNGTSGGVFVLAEGVKGAGEELEILPPLFIYGDDGRYSDEVDRILGGSSFIRSSSA